MRHYYSKKFFVTTLLVSMISCISTATYAQSSVTSVPNSIVTSGAGSGWNNLLDLSLMDGNATTTTALALGGSSKNIILSDLGFNIPSTAVISSVSINLRVKAAGALGYVVKDKSIRLLVGGSPVGNDNASATDWPGTFTDRVVGGTTDDWNVTLTPADVNSSSFGVLLSVKYAGLVLPTAYIDYISVTVYYDNALPVMISSFTATSNSGHNHLSWQTVSELNNEHFIVQKSTNGIDFYELATIPGHGTTNTVQRYSYDDYTSSSGEEYYRLIQKDIDGSIMISAVVTIGENSAATASIMQSDRESYLVISNCEGKNIEVVFSDLSGKIVFNQTLIPNCNTHTISLNENIPAYQAVIIRASYDGQLFSESFVINQ